MIDDNWELIEGEAAHAIEVLNYSNQVNVIEALVYLLMHHHSGDDGSCTHSPNANVLKEFHRTATLFLLHAPGEFRDGPVVVTDGNGSIVHKPPPDDEVPSHIDRFFDDLVKSWPSKTPQEIGAFCLWMINWVHPFKNGNGRSARAFCYACLCLKIGFVLPGTKTVIDLIMEQRDDYYAALRVADNAYDANAEPDLAPMIEFVDRLLFEQLSSIPDAG
jgi:Fic family protein